MVRHRQQRRREERDDFADNDPTDDAAPTGKSPLRFILVPILAVAGLGLIVMQLMGLSFEDMGGFWLLIPALVIAMAIGRGALR